MASLKFSDVLTLLEPGTGQVLLWSIFLYVLFFFGVLTLLLTPDKNMLPTLLIATVMLFAIVGKLSVTAYYLQIGQPIIRPNDFGMFVINAGMFIFPLIAVGTTRAKKKPSVGPAIITSLVAAVYFFAFWLVAQH